MQNEFDYLKKKLEVNISSCISYSQFLRILKIIDYKSFNEINNKFFCKTIKKYKREWIAIAGKELRGTIDKLSGEKRSENIVQQVFHKNKESSLIEFYNGSKESEKTTVKNYFNQIETLDNKAFTLDALHTDASLMETINTKGGVYLMQVKANQANLLKECQHLHKNISAKHCYQTLDKKHGRLEVRKGFSYILNVECLDKKWRNSNIQSLIVIQRDRTVLKNKKQSIEIAYFVSNLKLNNKSGKELFEACRKHWGIETDNHVRDVNFGEDNI